MPYRTKNPRVKKLRLPVIELGIALLLIGCGSADRELVLNAVPERPDLNGWPDRLYQRLENAEIQALNGRSPIESLKELGNLYHANGFYMEASRCYQALIGLEPDEDKWSQLAASIREIGNNYSTWSNLPDAWRVELFSDCFDVQRLARAARSVENQGDVSSGIRLLKRAIQLSSKNADLHFQMGDSYLKQGDAVMALKSFENCTKIQPELSEGWYQIFQIHESNGNIDMATRALSEGLLHNPDSLKLQQLANPQMNDAENN